MSETVSNGKNVAIISHLTLIGWIVALVMNSSNKTSLGSFYIKQMLGLILLMVMANFLARFVDFLFWPVWAMTVVLWAVSLIGAIQGQEKPLPILGAKFQEWFNGVA